MIGRLLRSWLLLLALLLTVAPATAQGYEPAVADLAKDAALEAVLDPKERTLPGYLSDLATRTGRSIVILGFGGSRLHLDAFRKRPARDLLVEMATGAKAAWRSHDRFLLLYPAEMERHAAKPVSRTAIWKELEREVSVVFAGDFMGTVQNLGKPGGVALLPVGPNAPPGAVARSFMPCVVAIKDRTLDDVQQMLTVLTGDPWDHWHGAHLLCFNGRPLSGDERRIVDSTIASLNLSQSISRTQRKLIDTERGLLYSDLTLRQKGDLAAATARIREKNGAGPEGLVIHRVPRAPHLEPDPYVDISVRTATGLIRVGSIRFY
jgi:hypothetical protein